MRPEPLQWRMQSFTRVHVTGARRSARTESLSSFVARVDAMQPLV